MSALFWLPPSLPMPTSQKCPFFTITFQDVSYLQISHSKPIQVQYKWWGAEPYSFSLSNPIHRFGIAVSKEMFFAYCLDMGILEVQLKVIKGGAAICKGFINFKLIKDWKGEEYEHILDLKSVKNGAKMGEVKIAICVSEGDNPYFFNNQSKREQDIQEHINNTNNNISAHQQQKKHYQTVKNGHRYSLQANIFNRQSLGQQKQLGNWNNFIGTGTEIHINQQPDIAQRKQKDFLEQNRCDKHSLDDTKTRVFHKFGLPLPDTCICENIKPNRFLIEKIQLQEDLEFFFNQSSNEDPQHLIIQLIGWQPFSKSDQNLGCSISMPIINQQGKIKLNRYIFGNGKGEIRVQIGKNDNMEVYLKEGQMEVQVGENFVGRIALWKIIGSKGNPVSISIYEVKNKRETLKGHYLVKLKVTQIQRQKQDDHTKQKNEASPSHNEKMQQKQQYLWIYLKQFHYLQPSFTHLPNTFIKIKTHNKQETLSKTIWKNDSPIFNQILTMKCVPKTYFEVWNRQATDKMIGKGVFEIQGTHSYQCQVGIKDLYDKNVGFLTLCFGKGDLVDATNFLNTHAQCPQKQLQKQKKSEKSDSEENRRKIEPNIFQDISGTPQPSPEPSPRYSDPIQSNQQTQNIPNQNSQWGKHQSSKSIDSLPIRPIPQILEELSILEIHNRVFTFYLKTNESWLSNMNSNPTLEQFAQVLQPVCNSPNRAKFSLFYLNRKQNFISLSEVKQSFESFQVYYQILQNQRDEALSSALQHLNNQGININEIETRIRSAVRSKIQFWKIMKQYINQNIVESLRYFYDGLTLENLCDELRKFEVYETTKGSIMPTILLTQQVMSEIAELLDIDVHSPMFKRKIRDTNLELSKFQELIIFNKVDDKERESQLIKSPTFGLLGTDRVQKHQTQNDKNHFPPKSQNELKKKQFQPSSLQQNSSIDIQTMDNQSASHLSQRFGFPKVSPINRQNKPTVLARFSKFNQIIQKIVVNGKQFHFNTKKYAQQIELQTQKQFNYQGYLQTATNVIQFDGPAQQWISLINENQEYCGCLIFQ